MKIEVNIQKRYIAYIFFTLAVLLCINYSIAQQTPDPGHSINEINFNGGFTVPNGDVILSSGDVGIGITNPSQRLDIDGAIQLGDTLISEPGVIRWNGSEFQGFNGSVWEVLTAEELKQKECHWMTPCTAGHSCSGYYESICPRGYYVAGYGYSAAGSSWPTYGHRIYCCKSNS